MGIGMIGDDDDLPTEHAIKTRRFIEHFKALMHKNIAKKDKNSVLNTALISDSKTSVKHWDVGQVQK